MKNLEEPRGTQCRHFDARLPLVPAPLLIEASSRWDNWSAPSTWRGITSQISTAPPSVSGLRGGSMARQAGHTEHQRSPDLQAC
jgi:hypothetical protein